MGEWGRRVQEMGGWAGLVGTGKVGASIAGADADADTADATRVWIID